ncbi:hypothetical protein [Kitasatospora griseola]|uniref:hypothetical protein n=1 Tax=Kitasatospora griseola TaxID=2064 RepID=UPI003424E512
MVERRVDEGPHGARHQIDFAASVISGPERSEVVCRCGTVTDDIAGHRAHLTQVRRRSAPAWLSMELCAIALPVGGVALLFGLMAVADTLLAGTARTAVLGLAPVVSFAAALGAGRLLRGFAILAGR